MAQYVMRVPDLGEGLVSAEVVAWHVKAGDFIEEDQPLVEMSTDKAVVEVPAPVTGRVVAISGAPGEVLAVGTELAIFEIGTSVESAAVGGDTELQVETKTQVETQSQPETRTQSETEITPRAKRVVRASPATRRAAREAGVDLQTIVGSGPGGRVVRTDLWQASTPEFDEIPVIGVRRVIAQRMSEAKRVAPHFAYVEEVDITELEWLRQRVNAEREHVGREGLSYLPFIAKALISTLKEFPQCNARYDAEKNLLRQYRSVHLGIATHTPQGLKVPVLRDAERLSLDELAEGIGALAVSAREGRASREILSGSTITLTSLGKLGGIVSTPILNLPEVAIVGINKAVERVVVHEGKMAIRRIMNLSSSFDHRFVDGYDAAAMIQRLKAMLEKPEAWAVD